MSPLETYEYNNVMKCVFDGGLLVTCGSDHFTEKKDFVRVDIYTEIYIFIV